MIKLKAELRLNEGLIKRVREILRGAPEHVKEHRVTVGIHEAEATAEAVKIASGKHNTNEPKNAYSGKASSTPLIDVAFFQEMGMGVPERSWLRTWFDQNVERLKVESTEAMRAEYSGNRDAVEALARKWGKELGDWIETGAANLPALSSATIKQRRAAGIAGDTPLFATGQLVRAIRAMADGDYA
jgi:hypothetical protein